MQQGDVSGDDLLAGQRNVDHEAVFGELGRAVDHRPVGSDHHAGAVEDELVLAPDQVHVHEGRPRRPGPGREHLLPLGRLAAVERGGVDVEQHTRPRPRLQVRRPVGEPHVLADRHPGGDAGDVPEASGSRPHEIAVLVEHPVLGRSTLR